MGELDGRVAIVTGSTRGIGRGIATRFAAEGASLVVHGRRTDDAERVAKELGGDSIGVGAEMQDSAQVDALIAAAVDRWGRLDVLVNNAGVARDNFVTRMTDERWNEVLATNLSGPFFAIRAAVPTMKEQESGSIINVVSWAGMRGNVGQVAYSASKAGLYGVTMSMAKELGKFGIRVNALAPSAITDMTGEMTEELTKEVVRRTPLKRVGTFEEMAEAALFLATDRSRFTTGQILAADGGIHLS
jgi:3-oxoacyl-[acyl-carrier protein] reductase